MATTKIKCPVEGIIDLDRLPGVPAAQVVALLDSRELQRLRAIRQLGYPDDPTSGTADAHGGRRP